LRKKIRIWQNNQIVLAVCVQSYKKIFCQKVLLAIACSIYYNRREAIVGAVVTFCRLSREREQYVNCPDGGGIYVTGTSHFYSNGTIGPTWKEGLTK
jgi:hypothetical protein